jgi:hypothetical protein
MTELSGELPGDFRTVFEPDTPALISLSDVTSPADTVSSLVAAGTNGSKDDSVGEVLCESSPSILLLGVVLPCGIGD